MSGKYKNKKESNYLIRHNSFNLGKSNYLNTYNISNNLYNNNLEIKENNKLNDNCYNTISYGAQNLKNVNKIKNLKINNTLNNIYESINKINSLNAKIKTILSNKKFNTIDYQRDTEPKEKNKINIYMLYQRNKNNNNSKYKNSIKNFNYFNRGNQTYNSLKASKKLINMDYNNMNYNPENFTYLNYNKKSKYGCYKPILFPEKEKIYKQLQNKGQIKEVDTESNYLSDYETIINQSSKLLNESYNYDNNVRNSNKYEIFSNRNTDNYILTNKKRKNNLRDIILLEKYKQIELEKLENINTKKYNNFFNDEDMDIFEQKIKRAKCYNSCNNSNRKKRNNFNNNTNSYFKKYFQIKEDFDSRFNNNDKFSLNKNNDLYKGIKVYQSSKNIFKNQNFNFNSEIIKRKKRVLKLGCEQDKNYIIKKRKIPFNKKPYNRKENLDIIFINQGISYSSNYNYNYGYKNLTPNNINNIYQK